MFLSWNITISMWVLNKTYFLINSLRGLSCKQWNSLYFIQFIRIQVKGNSSSSVLWGGFFHWKVKCRMRFTSVLCSRWGEGIGCCKKYVVYGFSHTSYVVCLCYCIQYIIARSIVFCITLISYMRIYEI